MFRWGCVIKPVKFQPIKNKTSAWPVWYRSPDGGGTVYLPAEKMQGMIEKHGFSGQAWQFRRMWKTYRPGGGVMYKAIDSLSPKDEEDFWHIMQSNYLQGFPPPTSFAGIFHRCCFLPWPRISVIAPFHNAVAGAWSLAIEKGVFREKVYQYDINSAYRWSACQGLPSLKSGKRVYNFESDRSVFLVEFDERNKPPWFTDKTGLITSEELQQLQIRPRLLFGVQFRDWLDLSPVFKEIDKRFPYCFKRIGRAFWGRWNGRYAVQQHGWKDGHKVRQLDNPLHNPIWAHYITSRIKLRLQQAVQQVGAFHVQVDAVLCRDQLPVSSEVGGWKLVNEFERGVWVQNTGQWGHGQFVVKRMGLTQREAEQWLIQKA